MTVFQGPSRRRCLQLAGGLLAGWAGAARPASAVDAQALGQLAPWPARKPTPPLRAQTLQGQVRSLKDYAGSPLIVNFWASYCAPCRLEMPVFNQLLARYRDQGLRVLAVNHGEMPMRVAQFLQAVPFEGEVLLDRSQTQLQAWGGAALPSSFVLDAQGRIHGWHMGELDWMRVDVQARLEVALQGLQKR